MLWKVGFRWRGSWGRRRWSSILKGWETLGASVELEPRRVKRSWSGEVGAVVL